MDAGPDGDLRGGRQDDPLVVVDDRGQGGIDRCRPRHHLKQGVAGINDKVLQTNDCVIYGQHFVWFIAQLTKSCFFLICALFLTCCDAFTGIILIGAIDAAVLTTLAVGAGAIVAVFTARGKNRD